MSKDTFKENLERAIEEAIRSTEMVIVETVHEPYIFLVHDRQGERMARCSKGAFADLVYKDGALPRWINLQIGDVTEENTIFKVELSDDYTEDDREYSGQLDGCPPFHVMNPAFPREVMDRV